MPPKPITETACAKVNLTLHVTGRRADGYHLLDSLVVFCGIADRLQAMPAGRTSLTVAGPEAAGLPTGDDNLVMRAAAVVAPDFPVAFWLEKNLPAASGIGGGSADAAAAIRAVLRLQGAGGGDRIDRIAQSAALGLGADVPVCLQSRPARMRGVGEDLTPFAMPPAWIVLANPRIAVSTPAVFRALTRRENAAMPATLPQWADLQGLAGWLAEQRNDLQAPACSLVPAISDVIAALSRAEGALIARMSGSGATCFALFATEAAAASAAARIGRDHPAWWTAAGPVLTA